MPAPIPQPLQMPKSDPNARKLVVGREIVLSGEIACCDQLVVEGTVKANVACNDLLIADGGLFTGAATVSRAEIVGRFEGELAVSERLFIRATGKVSAKVRYNQIEVERVGQISGTIQAQLSAPPASQPLAPLPLRDAEASAPKPQAAGPVR